MARIDITVWDEELGIGRLGRHAEHDSRSRAYAVEPEGVYTPQPVVWRRWSEILDQGQVGSCTGNAMAGWLGCAPHATDAADAAQYDETAAVKLYELATRLDRVPGYYLPGDPDSQDTGSTGTAVAKAAKRLGLVAGYGWAFTVPGMLWALRSGACLIGSVWTSDMDNPDSDGYVSPTGTVRGGHEYLCRGWEDVDGGRFVCDQSWGPGFGVATDSTPDGGTFYIRFADWAALRSQQADVTVPKR